MCPVWVGEGSLVPFEMWGGVRFTQFVILSYDPDVKLFSYRL